MRHAAQTDDVTGRRKINMATRGENVNRKRNKRGVIKNNAKKNNREKQVKEEERIWKKKG